MIQLLSLKANPSNPRVIKNDRFKALVRSVTDFPKMMALRPLVVDENGTVLGGNQRLKALMEAGYKEVPDEWVKQASELTEDERRRFILVDNEGYGETNFDMLANEYEVNELLDWGIEVPGVDLDENEFGTDFSLPDGDKAPFQQMTFTLADAQAELIKQAIKDVDVMDGTQYGNENSNGNALHQIVLEWAGQRK